MDRAHSRMNPENIYARLKEEIRKYGSIQTLFSICVSCGPRREKTCLLWFANNKGADQPAHPRAPFVFRVCKSIISKRATSEISTF